MAKTKPGVRYSEEQMAAIGTLSRETLVSAGAGSGKTSAVTQRVVNLVSGTEPGTFQTTQALSVDLDRASDIRSMLIVTFTKAGASEMRTRIVQALESAAGAQKPGSAEQKWLAAQADAALSAEIGTIHSMCARILRNHYEISGIVPDFSVMDENVGKDLRKECARQALEEFIQTDPHNAHDLLIRYGPSISKLSDRIDSIVPYADSQPDPDTWIERHWGRPDGERDDLSVAELDAELLGRLALRTRDIYRDRKNTLGLLDYADLEHMTLKTVRELRRQGENFGDQFEFAFVDEYQDINPVQEELLQELTTNSTVFMVGDMKQSIYGFRFAAPANFASKDEMFAAAQTACDPCETPNQTSIHMNCNYRSTRAVVGFTNAVMRQLMSEDCGGVAYDDQHKLVFSRVPESDDTPAHGCAKILIAEGNQKDEARMIADKICELHDAGRPLEDIVVLTRSMSGTSARTIHYLRKYLREKGIATMMRPTAQSTVETEIFLNLLRLLDNPKQDVALLSVMRSIFFGFDERDFSRIAAWHTENADEETDEKDRKKPEYHAAFNDALYKFETAGRNSKLTGEDEELYDRLVSFEETLQQFRSLMMTKSVREAADEIARRLDFRAYLLMQPDGTDREQAFTDMLDQLEAREQISGPSLHAVLEGFRHMENRKNPQMDAIPGVVRIMTVHASKGLEFPVVFIANLEKELKNISQEPVQTSDSHGITVKEYDPQNMVAVESEASKGVCDYRKNQDRSEELRLLYVALTRARDEIYVCASAKSIDEVRKGKSKVLHWVMQAWDAVGEADEAADAVEKSENSVLRNAFSGELWSPPEVPAESTPVTITRPQRDSWRRLDPRQRVSSAVSVTEQYGAHDKSEKHTESGESEELDDTKDVVKGGLFGSDRGTLLHHVLEWVVSRRVTLDEAIRQMQENELLTKAGLLTLDHDRPKLEAFTSSDLGRRAAAADVRLTERSFILEADPVDGPDEEGRKTLLKGTIDLAFLEDGAWTIVDYKSDSDAAPDTLRKLHSAQLQIYKRALEELTDYPVRDTYIFSLHSGEAVLI